MWGVVDLPVTTGTCANDPSWVDCTVHCIIILSLQTCEPLMIVLIYLEYFACLHTYSSINSWLCVLPTNLSHHTGMKLVPQHTYTTRSVIDFYDSTHLYSTCHYDESVRSIWLGCVVTSPVTGWQSSDKKVTIALTDSVLERLPSFWGMMMRRKKKLG